jgi:phosphatidylglycerophosphate synthase
MTEFRTDEGKILEAITKKGEMKILVWIIPRLPRWVTPDGLTLLGILCAFGMLAGYALARQQRSFLWLNCFLLVVHWFADSTDGALAKFRKRPRPRYGHYVDRICDFITLTCISLGLSLYGIPALNAILLLIGYALLFVHSLITYQFQGLMQESFGLFGPTEARLVVFILNIHLFFGLRTAMSWAILAVGAGMILVAAFSILKTARRLDREDRANWPKE